MNTELRMQLQIARTGHYGDIMRTTIFAQLALTAVIGFGATGVTVPLVIAAVTIALFGALGGSTALDDISILRDDMDEATGSSAYGKQAKARNLALLKALSAGLIALIAAAQIYVLLT